MDDLAVLFEQQEITESAKDKIKAIFESAVAVKVKQIEADLKEQAEISKTETIKRLEEMTEQYIEVELKGSVDKYLTASVNEFIEQNRVAIESDSKVKLAESFLTGIVGIAESFNVSVPEKAVVDQVAKLEAQLGSVQEQLNAEIDKSISLKENIKVMEREGAFKEVTKDLADTQKEKISQVSESLKFESKEQFSAAVKELIESYFPVSAKQEPVIENKKNEIVTENKSQFNDPFLAALREKLRG